MQTRLLLFSLAVVLGAPMMAAPLTAQDPARTEARSVPAADSLNRAAREALNRGDYRGASALFGQLQRRYPQADVARSALYWQAFALYRNGSPHDLREAREVLARQSRTYPDVMSGDVQSLLLRVEGSLAQLGDASAAERVVSAAAPTPPAAPAHPGAHPAPAAPGAPAAPAHPGVASVAPVPPGAPGRTRGRPAGCPEDEDHEVRVAALNALMQMDSERALPILQQILQRRDACSVELRRRAVFLVQQKGGAQAESILLDIVRNDPDAEVRGQAVHWLGSVNSESAVNALEQIVRTSNDQQLQQRALFALSQHRSGRGQAILRAVAEDERAPLELRGQAVHWLGHGRTRAEAGYLRELYGRVRNTQLRERLIYAISQSRDEEDRRWLMDLALRSSEPAEVRKQALYWAAQRQGSPAELVALYDRVNEREMKEQLIYLFAQRRSEETTNKLIDIVRNERDPELRKRGIFWLSQSRDPRAVDVLREVIQP